MGGILSVPLLVLPTLAGAGTWIASCCGAAACNALCRACGSCQSSIATRVAYAALFLINSLLSWIMLSSWAITVLKRLTPDYLELTCPNGKCYGLLAVHRINFALGVLHILLAVALYNVQSTKDKRSSIQNGWWGPKFALWFLLVIVSFLLPNGFFIVWGNWFSMIGSVLFIIYSLILLIDCAHNWAETCLEKYEDTGSKTWQLILVGSTLGMYLAAITITIVMFVYFGNSGCGLNQAFISTNLVLSILSTGIAIHPFIQEYNTRSGLVQSAMVSIYATYLTFSAVCNEPDDRNCNPLARSKGSQTASVIIGAIFTFLAIAYSTTRAATQTGGIGNAQGDGYVSVGDADSSQYLITSEPTSRSQMRREAVRAAVETGGLPASALEDDEESSGGNVPDNDDEKGAVQYHYTTFHFIFFLATCYTACLLTSWNTLKSDNGWTDNGLLVHIGRSYTVVWVKIISSWVVYLLYIWSLLLSIVQERFAY